MRFTSTPFLFLFLPLSIIIYYLISKKFGMKSKNIFLLCISLAFYAWGEPIAVFVLIFLIFITQLSGKAADRNKNTSLGKIVVLTTVLINIFSILLFERLDFLNNQFDILYVKEQSALINPLPLSLSFFALNSVSYVVDIYKGKCKSSDSLIDTALYLTAFFKVLQGPLVSFHEFDMQIKSRKTTAEQVGNGIWRFAIGFVKTILIAENLTVIAIVIFPSDYNGLSLSDSWFGCLLHLLYFYLVLSGYADMSIGLGTAFGFNIPENFNYPHISVSLTEYIKRWNITVYEWFNEYLYVPVFGFLFERFNRFGFKDKIKEKPTKEICKVIACAITWIVMSLWYKSKAGFLLWGLLNCIVILIESHNKVGREKSGQNIFRRICLFLYLLITEPLICTESLEKALMYYRAMFGGTGSYAFSSTLLYFTKLNLIYFIVGLVLCFPVLSLIKRKLGLVKNRHIKILLKIIQAILLMIFVIASIAFLFRNYEL